MDIHVKPDSLEDIFPSVIETDELPDVIAQPRGEQSDEFLEGDIVTSLTPKDE
jgi:hypothetical protein